MTTLDYKFTNDTLFKMLFVKHQDLLQSLVSALLEIPNGSIGQFHVTNPEIPPESLGEKFCRLDINMTVDGEKVDLEVQVSNEGDYRERSLYYWAREYSSSLGQGLDYAELPRVVVVSILAYNEFDCAEEHSEFEILEKRRHERLTDRLSLHYFELPKLSQDADELNGKDLWLALFNAKTEEDLTKIEGMGVPEMAQAIQAYRTITVTDEFREAERLRSLARSNEAAALRHARQLERQEADAEWKMVVDAKEAALADKDLALAEQAAIIARYRARYGESE